MMSPSISWEVESKLMPDFFAWLWAIIILQKYYHTLQTVFYRENMNNKYSVFKNLQYSVKYIAIYFFKTVIPAAVLCVFQLCEKCFFLKWWPS